MKPVPALQQAMEDVIAAQVEKLAIPRRYTTDMKEIWALQPRLLNRAGRRPYKLLEHPRLRAGFDFLRLRCRERRGGSRGRWTGGRGSSMPARTSAHDMLLPDKGAQAPAPAAPPAPATQGGEPGPADDAVSAT